MSVGAFLVAVLFLILIAALPSWKYSRGWGYLPAGIVALLLVAVIALLALGKI